MKSFWCASPELRLSGRELISIVLGLFFLPFLVSAEIPEWWKEVHQYDPKNDVSDYYTYTSGYFGPNALPIPELYDARIPLKHQAEIFTDVFWGFGDQTQSLSARLTYVPLPGRVAIGCWGVLYERYKITNAVRDRRASDVENGEGSLAIGDIYLSTQFRCIQEKRYVPNVNVEIVLKTAASKSPYDARYFDTPGYWFDLTAGKSFCFPGALVQELRFVGTIGFLCYQLNSSDQNDAPLYGGKAIVTSRSWSFEGGVHGYSGWLDAGDKPLVLRSKLTYGFKRMRCFTQFQYALRDYPFHRIQTGLSVDF